MKTFLLLIFGLILPDMARGSVPSNNPIGSQTHDLRARQSHHSYDIISNTVAYKRWRSIIHRVVKMPNGNVVDFDVSYYAYINIRGHRI